MPVAAQPNAAGINQQQLIEFSTQPPIKSQGLWHTSPIVSRVIDNLLIKNWESIDQRTGKDWSNQITDLALEIASDEVSAYATKALNKLPFILNASIDLKLSSQGSTNLGGDALFKLAEFGAKPENTRDGLAFLHTKYTGHVSNGSTMNVGLGIRHLLGDDVLAGVNGYWDYRTTDYSSSYSRFGVGAEAFWKSLSLRNNWYISGTGKKSVEIYNVDYYERVVPGWDVEVGYRIPSFPQVGLYARYFRWDYQQRSDNSGLQGTVSYQMTPHLRVDSWISNEIPANSTVANRDLDDRQDMVFGVNLTLSAKAVTYKPNDFDQILQQEMTNPVRRRYDVLLERWRKSLNEDPEQRTFTNLVGGN